MTDDGDVDRTADDRAAETERRAIEQRLASGLPFRPRTARDFEESYAGTPPWDIGRPQPGFVELAGAGAVRGRVLDSGCGTGEHTLMAASIGCDATGIDLAVSAIDQARAKAREREVGARFLVHDALDAASLGEQFDTALDSGLFHVFGDDDRVRYVDALRRVLVPGGQVLLMCFSDRQPGDWGPRRVSQDELRASFSGGWQVESIDAAEFDVNLEPGRARAWRAVITRI
ncbi:MAG TPA: class I SAM-dependent methyltransferase [Acidimicrobiia bacterium]|nr:class I SAM-dependent methyltransferase [Acidimicrobiia bacterium]